MVKIDEVNTKKIGIREVQAYVERFIDEVNTKKIGIREVQAYVERFIQESEAAMANGDRLRLIRLGTDFTDWCQTHNLPIDMSDW
jgi:hypothetical protein